MIHTNLFYRRYLLLYSVPSYSSSSMITLISPVLKFFKVGWPFIIYTPCLNAGRQSFHPLLLFLGDWVPQHCITSCEWYGVAWHLHNKFSWVVPRRRLGLKEFDNSGHLRKLPGLEPFKVYCPDTKTCKVLQHGLTFWSKSVMQTPSPELSTTINYLCLHCISLQMFNYLALNYSTLSSYSLLHLQHHPA